VAQGQDPANQKATERGTPTVAELADRFIAEQVKPKCKGRTAEFYRDILDHIVKPALGANKADKLTRPQVTRLHSALADTPFQANRVLAVIGSMYSFASRAAIAPEGTNPARGIDKFKESYRERFLNSDELERLGNAIREAETTGLPLTIDENQTQHQARTEDQAYHNYRSFCSGGTSLASLYGLPLERNLALAVGARRFGARLPVLARQQERSEDRHPQRPCPRNIE
jgi:hypothetical protein